jgi:hypothetical protein
LVFDWLVLETLSGSTIDASTCLAVLSSESQKRRIPPDRIPLLEHLVSNGVLSFDFVDEDRHVGGYIRQRIAERSDVLVALGGGKGVIDLHAQFTARGLPTVPLDVEIGASCADGEGALGLNRIAFTRPESCFPLEPKKLQNSLLSISFQGATRPIDDLVRGVVHLVECELKAEQTSNHGSSATPQFPIRVLFVAAAPVDQDELDHNEEGMSILEQAFKGIAADGLTFQILRKATPQGLRSRMASFRPNVLFFSGHGFHDRIVLQDDVGASSTVEATALAELVRVFQPEIRLVILNSCSSDRIASHLVDVVDFAIGMSGEVCDVTAMAFAEGFFDGLANGVTVQQAFDLGRANCKLAKAPFPDMPCLHVRPGSDASTVVLARVKPNSAGQ